MARTNSSVGPRARSARRYYTVGEILVRAHSASRRAEDERPIYRDAVFTNLDSSGLPHLAALADRWPTLTARDTYRQGLRAFVDGLLAEAASARRH